MSKRKTSTDAASTTTVPTPTPPDPVVHQPRETDHDDVQPHDHPQGDRHGRRPVAEDTRVNDGGRSGSEGDVVMGTSEEDARSRRRDLGP
jgi:hypothetical protein